MFETVMPRLAVSCGSYWAKNTGSMVPPRLSTVRKRELSGPPTVSITRSTPLTTSAAYVLV